MDNLDALAEALVASSTALLGQLREARAAAGLSVETVAERMGVSVGTVRSLERYDANPSLSTIRRYALAVGVLVSFTVTAPGS